MIRRFLRWLGFLPPLPSLTEMVVETIRRHPEAFASNAAENNVLLADRPEQQALRSLE